MSIPQFFHQVRFFARHLLFPSILAAKVKSIDDYKALIGWGDDGKNTISRITASSNYAKEVIARCSSQTTKFSAGSLYNMLQTGARKAFSQDEETIRSTVKEMCSLINIITETNNYGPSQY